MIELHAIDIDETQNSRFSTDPECAAVLRIYPDYYSRVGYNPPWIGYVALNEDGEVVGCGGFKGAPKEGKIEIAYTTFERWQGRGIGAEICRHLVLLALQTDPAIRVTARTLPEPNASTRILTRNGFACTGTVYDDEDGNVWEWELEKPKG